MMANGFVGHDEAVVAVMDAFHGARLHHAWLLTGPRGVGKASFADLAARRLLAEAAGPPVDRPGLEVPPDHRIAALVDAGSHPDLVRLERRIDEKTGAVARSITVDQVRSLQRLFSTTGSYSSRRIVIIDAIDDLERAAANALLKNLEEPPTGSLFLLVSHAPGRLLPTIRSRCRILRFQTLGDDAMSSVLRRELPDAAKGETDALVRVGEGSPGRALAFAGLDITALDAAIASLIATGDPTNGERSALARSLSLKAAQPRYEAFLERVPAAIAAQAQKRSGPELAKALKTWEEARDLAGSAVPLSLDIQSTVFVLGGMLAALGQE
jgi:DNA polymerase-3 subunit delta'